MWKKTLRISFFICALLITNFAIAKQNYSAIYVFGDSLSENGNGPTYLGSPLPDPPYDNNRLTNGDNAVEVLAGNLDLPMDASLFFTGMEKGTNYAVGGATAGGEGPGDLASQITAFTGFHIEPSYPPATDALYIIFIGGNDIRLARDAFSSGESALVIDTAIAGISNAINSLLDLGAQHIMVINSPDIGAIPETLIGADLLGLPWLPPATTLLTKVFNFKLYLAIRTIELERGVELIHFNLFKTFSDIMHKTKKYKLINITEPCYITGPVDSDGDGYRDMTINPSCIMGFDSAGEPIANFDGFFFVDEIHPTAKVHEIIGDSMEKYLRRY